MGKFEFNISQQIATGYNVVQPVVPFKQVVSPAKVETTEIITGTSAQKYDNVSVESLQVSQCCGITLMSANSDKSISWTANPEPLISVSGKNTVAKRYVAKSLQTGSVKEFWSRDDFSVTISGVIYAPKGDYSAITELVQLCRDGAYVQVSCEFLQAFGIDYLVVESFDFPFTAGEENYQYTIKAVSDDNYQTLTKA